MAVVPYEEMLPSEYMLIGELTTDQNSSIRSLVETKAEEGRRYLCWKHYRNTVKNILSSNLNS